MDEQVQHVLEQGGVIDITTRGRHTGQPRRIEIRFHHISPFALSILHILNFKLPVKISSQPQPLDDGFLHR